MTFSDSSNGNLIPSNKQEPTKSSMLVTRGLNLAEKITDLSKRKASILIVNDDQDILDVLDLVLSEFYKFSMFQNGLDALEELERNNYDMLITGFMQPGINGIDLIKKAQSLNPPLATLLMPTNKEDPPIYYKEIPKMFAKIRTTIMMAPFEPSILLKLIKRVLRKNKPNLLIANHSSYMLEVFELMMGQQYKIDKTYIGRGALEELGRNNYDMLITDFDLSDINGAEFIKNARKLKPELLTIIVSEKAEEINEAASAFGCVACFELDVIPTVVEETIEKALKLNG